VCTQVAIEAKQPSTELLDELVRRIVAVAHPRRIILFGSAARGEMGPNSDLDVLVVMPNGTDRKKTSQEIILGLWGFGFAVDAVVVTEDDVRKYGANHSLVIKPALKDGRELYHAAEGATALQAVDALTNSEGSCSMPPARLIPGSPEDWLARARGDLALARSPLPDGGFYEDLCFHAQQAAEKAFKAVYQDRGWEFRYTHNLEELARGLEKAGLPLPPNVQKATQLTRFAWLARYPAAEQPVTAEEHREAIQLAESVYTWAEKVIAEGK